jgi:prepilin-type N-terminal cleavage/methylation domain-containing protein
MIRKRAFTLIELLVVIAIIALLLSILVPTLKKAKGQAQAVIEQSNLRSMGQAVDLYLTQNKDKFFNYPAAGTLNTLWLEKIGDMVDNIDEIRFCPKTVNKIEEVKKEFNGTNSIWEPPYTPSVNDRPWLWARSADPTKKYEMGSYGLNGWLYADANAYVPAGDKDKPYAKRTDVRIPSRTPVLLDANWVDGWAKTDNVLPATAFPLSGGYNYAIGDTTGGTTATAIGRFVLDRHGPMTTVVFADAHAETITHAELWTLSWHKGSKPNFNPVIPKPIPAKR